MATAGRFYRIASKVATLNAALRNAERKVFMNTFHKARSNSTVAWPPPNLLRNYQKFQQAENMPVHLKGGFQDRMIFSSTLALIAIGMFDGLYTLLGMAFPKKKM